MKTKILYEDEAIYVIYKPAGIAVQSSRVGEMDVEHELLNYSVRKDRNAYIGIVHRLDQPVEGVLVVARTKQAAAELSNQLSTGISNKHYYVIAYLGDLNKQNMKPVEDVGQFEDYMIKQGKLAAVVTRQTPNAKSALLHYKKLNEFEDTMLLDVEIETGRFHQIRTQFASRRIPLVGDTKYGTEKSIAFSAERGIKSVALCAYQISFRHPNTRKQMDFKVQPENPAFLQYL